MFWIGLYFGSGMKKISNTYSQVEHALAVAHKGISCKQGLYTYFVGRRPQGTGLRCECVFLYLIKKPCFVTHRILRSKSNTYYMKAAAGYFPTIPGHFVYYVQLHKKRVPAKSLHVWFVLLVLSG